MSCNCNTWAEGKSSDKGFVETGELQSAEGWPETGRMQPTYVDWEVEPTCGLGRGKDVSSKGYRVQPDCRSLVGLSTQKAQVRSWPLHAFVVAECAEKVQEGGRR